MKRLPPWLAALPATITLVVVVTLMRRAMLHHTGGQPTYPVDDAFIHLAIAKRIAFDHTYGVVPGVFAGASSSVLWPWLLASAMRVFGDNANLALYLNVLFGAAVPFAVVAFVRKFNDRWSVAAFVALAVVLLVPLPTLVAIGMEHVAHLLLTLLVFLAAIPELEGETNKWLPLLCALTVSIRYEGLFVVGFIAGLLVLQRRFARAAALLACGGAPVVLFGLYSKMHGGYFLPTSVLLKGRPMHFDSFDGVIDALGGGLLERLFREHHLTPLCLSGVLLSAYGIKVHGLRARVAFVPLLFSLTLLAHVQFAGLGWFFRYDAYLVGLGVVVIAASLASDGGALLPFRARELAPWLVLALAAVVVDPVWRRAQEALTSTPLAGRNIFQQQVQSAHFLESQYPKDVAAINDIGAVTYYRAAPIVDLVGLANKDVAAAKKMHLDTPMSREDFKRLSREAKIAIVYDEWFEGLIPADWLRVSRWMVESNKVCASAWVSIYATSPELVPRAIEAVRAFVPKLPDGVRVEGLALETRTPGDRVQPGDWIVVEVPQHPEWRGVYEVKDNGALILPRAKPAFVRGLTLEMAQHELASKLRDVPDTTLAGEPTMSIARRRTKRVYVMGKVAQSVHVEGNDVTLEAAIAAAGGARAPGRADQAWVWRQTDHGFARVEYGEASRAVLEDLDVVVVP